ncbi:hypothetical protein, partial [Nocardia sp. NPDC058497]|uniref:hypothetical protein n=1 Tax=Nocardia sp. NPDC058497 TaxID=3346529 RepID=UPI00364AA8EF
MSGDPVEESGQAVRQGFVQALQTAHTTAGLFRSWGADSRSHTESNQRVRLADAKDFRSAIEHQGRLGNLGLERELIGVRIAEVRARITNAAKITGADVRHKEGLITRAEKDLERREEAGKLDRTHSEEAHKQRIAGYVNRETRAVELHDLDVEYKKLLIDIRRRAAGFTDTLHQSDQRTGSGQASAAQFAAAEATRNLSPDADAAAAAYRERFVEDTGLNPEDLFADGDRADVADGWSHGLEDVAGLAEDLTIAAHLHHEFGLSTADIERDSDPNLDIVDAEVLEAGEWIEDTVSATGVHDLDPAAADPGLVHGGEEPSARVPGKEVEVWSGDPCVFLLIFYFREESDPRLFDICISVF